MKAFKKRKCIGIFLLCLFICAIVYVAHGKTIHPERYYQEKWCDENNGEMEVILPDKTRCDCITETHAIEMDFAKKWAESIGQSLYYASQTGKHAGIVLIMEKSGDERYLDRIHTTIKYFNLPIVVWSMKGQQQWLKE